MTVTVDKPKLKYYNFNKINSFNGVFNFIIGARGLGKTYGAKFQAIKKGIERGDEFIYLRRYKEELKAAIPSFFADLADEFPNHDFRVNGIYAEYAHESTRDEKKREWRRIGYFLALSTAQKQKSVSFPKVKTIIYDEFIIEKGVIHYLPNEAEAFVNFFSTVDRNKDKTKVFFLANSVSISNPYFIHYDIQPKADEEWIRKFDNFIVAHFPDSEEFKAGVYATRFGKFIQQSDPEYAAYAVGNEFKDNSEALIDGKPASAKYAYTLETKTGVFSVWLDYTTHIYYIQEKRPKNEFYFTMCPEKMEEGKVLLEFSDKQLGMLRSGFRKQHCYFDSPKTRNAFLQVFKR